MIVWAIILLLVGILLLVKGADFFVDGSSSIAKLVGIPSLVVGLTLVSMGTSAPEASVSIQASLSGANAISLGNVLGSNIANTLMILGLSALIAPMLISKEIKYYDAPIMVGISIVLALFCYVITPSALELWEGLILLVLFVGYLTFLILRSKKEIKQEQEENKLNKDKPLTIEEVKEKRIAPNLIIEISLLLILVVACFLFYYVFNKQGTGNVFETYESIIITAIAVIYGGLLIFRLISKKLNKDKEETIDLNKYTKKSIKAHNILKSLIAVAVGLGGVILGGTLVVDNASIIAKEFGMSETLVGLTIVAVGTSLPELVTSVIAAIKKENDIAVGNIVGSNIFNILFVLGLSSVISPIAIDPTTLFDGLVVIGVGVLTLIFCSFFKKMNRWQGGVLFALYVAYLAFIIVRDVTTTTGAI